MKTTSILFCVFCFIQLSAQNFESEIRSKGIVYPRLNTAQRDALSPAPIQGLCIYNIDHEKVECYNGSSWYKTDFLSLPTISFLPTVHEDYFGFTTDNGAHFTIPPSSEIRIQAPVYLPDKSVINKVTYYYQDTDAGTDVWFSFVKQKHENPAFTTGWFVPSVDTAYGSVFRLVNDTIDNSKYYYYLEMSENPNIVGVGPFMDGDFRIYSAIIEYFK